MEKLKVLELFGGIGACTKALKRIGVDFEVVDYVEIDPYAVKSYNAINGTNFEPQDIIKWDKNVEVDLIMHGSPCQDFSTAGLGKGGDEGSGTRSSLMYETIRIVEKLKPKYVVWENVKNMLSKKHVHNFNKYIDRMNELGYTNHYQILNAKDYGIPQNRERVFTVSIRNDLNQNFEFPPKQELKFKLKDIIEKEVDEKYYLSNRAIEGRLKTHYQKYKLEENVINDKELHPTILARFEGAPSLFVEEKLPGAYGRTFGSRGKIQTGDICSTLQSAMGTGGGNIPLIKDLRIRRLIPKETWRLMGFDDEDFEKAEKVNSNTQLYKQAGNSIVVNVLEAIFRELLGDCLKPTPTLNDLLKGL